MPSPLPAQGAAARRPSGVRLQKVQIRKDHIITVAARLMREKGYVGVSIDEIGKAAGISGPAIYKYFDSKVAVLAGILMHGNKLGYEMLSATNLDQAGPVEALKQRINAYIEYSVVNRDAMIVTVREANHVTAPYLEPFMRGQREIREDSVRILRMVRPELSVSDARFILTNVLQGLISSSAYLYPIDTEARRNIVFRMAFSALMS